MANTTFGPGTQKETVYSGPSPAPAGGSVYNGPAPGTGGTVYGGPAAGGTVYGGPGSAGTVYRPAPAGASRPATPSTSAAGTKGAAYFFVIAGFSTINTLLIMIGSPIVLGGGSATSRGAAPGMMTGIVVLNILVIGIFVLLGIFARQGSKAAFLIGMLLYGGDTALLLLNNPALHIPGIIVHAIFLVGLFKAFGQLE